MHAHTNSKEMGDQVGESQRENKNKTGGGGKI
jgi:hypothetical protein